MSSFLLELRSEEIPARMQAGARKSLHTALEKAFADAGLAVDGQSIQSYSTPRRLAIIVPELSLQTAPVSVEIKGPRTTAPDAALAGFLRKNALIQADLIDRDGVWFAGHEKPGRPTRDILAEAIPAIIRGFPWPKSMRWGDVSRSTESLRWVRPLQGIVALFAGEVVDCEIAGIASGRETMGHRFHSTGAIAVQSADTYLEQLRAAHVIVDQAEREALIRDGAARVAEDAGLKLIADEGLVIENAGLTEWPVPLLGRFDPTFLAVPPEVIQLTARANQKYFVCRDAAGALADAFVCTANIAARDGGAMVVEGNRKVLAARLADARFFFDTDVKVPLVEQAAKLDRITFHEKLGSVADKVARVAALAEWLASEGIVPGCDPALARRAAELCKADLVTGMVGEFPELQGVIGGYYAAAQGEPREVAEAIRDHYKPVGQGDDVPTAPVTVAVSLADKLVTIAGFFARNEKPTGSKDPFALRRSALGIIAVTIANVLRLPLRSALQQALPGTHTEDLTSFENMYWQKDAPEIVVPRYVSDLLDFLIDRLKVQQREAGIRHDLIDAVFALGGEDDLVRLLARVHALQAFIGTQNGENLLAAYKRTANILKREDWATPVTPAQAGVHRAGGAVGALDSGLFRNDDGGDTAVSLREPAEAALVAALDDATPRAAAAIAAEDFTAAMAALATLRAPIDAFFDQVTVNDPDPAKRTARLALLARFRDAVHQVADFSQIEG